MTMKIDGKVYSFNDSLYAIQQNVSPELTLYASGKTSGNLQLLLAGTAAGTYSAAADAPMQQAIYQCTVHAISGSANYQPLYNILLKPGVNVTNPFQLTITSVTSTSVSGNFHGQLSIWRSSGLFANITDGNFDIPFKQ